MNRSSTPQTIRRGRALARARAALAAFCRDPKGATAVEFSIVALPLLFMLFSIVELGLVFMISTSLDNATTNAARTIRTGAVQTAGGATATTFRNAICTNMSWMGSQCQSNLSVDVRTYTQFANPNSPDPVTNNTFDQTALAFTPGAACNIVLVRAFYQWPLVTPFLVGGLQKLSGGKALITAASTFRNEPYGGASC